MTNVSVLKKIEAGEYESRDGRYRIWKVAHNSRRGFSGGWLVLDKETGKTRSWATLDDIRKYGV